MSDKTESIKNIGQLFHLYLEHELEDIVKEIMDIQYYSDKLYKLEQRKGTIEDLLVSIKGIVE